MWHAYSRALQSHPIRTNVASAGCISIAGDVLAQRIENGSSSSAPAWDARRGASLAVWGFEWMGAPATLWFRWLSTRFPTMIARPDGTSLHAGNLGRVLLVHLTLFAPFTNAMFYGYKEAVSAQPTCGASWSIRFERRLRNEFVATTCYSWLFWTPAQAVNFTIVPLHFRPLYLNSLMVLWTAYLSFSGHRRYAVAEASGI